MKIKKSYLEKIIKEELKYLIIEESVELEEGWKE